MHLVHSFNEMGFPRIIGVEHHVYTSAVKSHWIKGCEDTKVLHFRSSRIAVTVTVDGEIVGNIDLYHLILAYMIDHTLAGISH